MRLVLSRPQGPGSSWTRRRRGNVALLVGLLVAAGLVGCEDADPRAAPDADRAAASPAVEPRTGAAGSDAGAGPAPADAALPADAPRVVFVGTSLTAGYGLADPARQAWPARVAELAREDGAPLRIVNAGVSGDTSAGGLRRVAALLDPAPAAVVLELGANDGLRGLPVDELRRNLDAAVDSIRRIAPAAAILVVRMEAPRNLGTEYVEAFAGVFDALDAQGGVVVTPFLLDGVAGVPALNQADGIHPVAEGHERMARIVWPVLRDELPTPAGDA